MNEEGEQN